MVLDDLKHAQRGRLIYLDRCLTWRGMANRRDLMARFDISSAQAALDFKLYLERAGRSPPIYDPVKRAYVAAPDHKPLVPTSVANAFLGVFLEQEHGVSNLLPRLERHADTKVVADLYQALAAREAVRIHYTSMTSGADDGQWIAPVNFASDGETIYVRAFSEKHQDYRHYLPIRIANDPPFKRKSMAEALPLDCEWHTRAQIWLRPKSTLSAQQAAAVRREYGFSEEFLKVETRQALEFFVERRWGLDQPGARLERVKTDYRPLGQ